MEPETKINSNPVDLSLQLEIPETNVSNDGDPGTNEITQTENVRKRHIDHGNRRYKMFSNHSSWNDMPHTNTSF